MNITTKNRFEKELLAKIDGARVSDVRYMTNEESIAMGWHGRKAIVIIFDNGQWIMPQQDDEGNGPGALTTADILVPVIV